MFSGASLFISRPFVIDEKIKVITSFSGAKSKVLEASFQLNNRHIFLVHKEVQKYLSSQPSVETVKATPVCCLKSMEKDGPVIALSCVIKAVVSYWGIVCLI